MLRGWPNDVWRSSLCQVKLWALARANYNWWDPCLDNEVVGWWVTLLIIHLYCSDTWQYFVDFIGVEDAHMRFTCFQVIQNCSLLQIFEDGKDIGIKVYGMLWALPNPLTLTAIGTTTPPPLPQLVHELPRMAINKLLGVRARHPPLWVGHAPILPQICGDSYVLLRPPSPLTASIVVTQIT